MYMQDTCGRLIIFFETANKYIGLNKESEFLLLLLGWQLAKLQNQDVFNFYWVKFIYW